MPLQHFTRKPLTLPDEIIKDDIVSLIITGSSYGGVWILMLRSLDNSPDAELYYGELETDSAPGQPDLAVEAAHAWLIEESEKLGFEVRQFVDQNEAQRQKDPDSADCFAAATAVLTRK